MRASQALSVVALFSTALAAPGWGNWGGDDVVTVTAYTTITVKGSAPTPVAQAQQTWQPAAAAASTWAPVASAAPVANDGSWQSVVSEWRSRMGLPSMQPSDSLVANALKTCQDGNGQMVHELNPGTMGQVLAPGQPDEFVKVFVGGWLCEMPDAPGMDGVCSTMSAGWAYGGETGHAEILRGTYQNIGCANAGGIWACDVS